MALRTALHMLDAPICAGHLGGTVAVDRTYVKARRSAAEASKKTQDHAIGVSRGGRTAKILAASDLLGRSIGYCQPAASTIRAVDEL